MTSAQPPPLDPEIFPPQYTFPPFYTRQPNSTTWASQRHLWATFILRYCRARKLWRVNLSEALDSELFYNRTLGRRLKLADALEVLEYMASEGQIEWDRKGEGSSGGGAPGGGGGGGRHTAVIWWLKPEEWAGVIYDWIDSTGQKNAVLTLYEISEGDLTVSQEFHGMDPYCVRRSLEVLTKRGVAQIFSINDEFGIKFF